ncbi:SMP-30/gluconolactonase/LRE family protein [Sphingomonas crocodyli]|uniref:Gluconolactonase n=1 Tax=Sphingomonas crocodyli TaxID=1979270 RepID=A0A437M0N8_9SPHN|nr:SMP-30/gluconolactonase/LRE family protein [Sphingomonas crocodyli]RVT91074.1 gluconolactonase [Sphingomonas crocodyli]
MTIEIEGLTTLSEGMSFTECPRWRDGWLYFSDMYGRTVYRVNEAGVRETICTVDKRPGGLGFTPEGDMLISEMDAGRVLRLRDGTLSVHADLSSAATSGTNDMIVSAEGRCYVGKFSHARPSPIEPILFVDTDGHWREMDQPVKVANGMILTADGKTLIVAESAGGRISAFDVGKDGVPTNYRLFAALPEGHYADGICGDDAGGVWVTCCRGPGVIRVEEGGAITHRITIGPEDGAERFAYACALGGADGKTLFVCTAGPYTPETMAETRTARIETVRVPFAGAGIP